MKSLMQAWTLIRAVRPLSKASKLYGRALRLDKSGKPREAFELTRQALDAVAGATSPVINGPGNGIILVMTVFYAQLATKVGIPSAADDAIRQALRLSAPLDHGDPEIREYVDWLRGRLGGS
jgi:hypothetical protein